ncbi:MAG: hypothetical protein MJB14_07365, partial [Spirochaetes bacterium]|nr:hypothetical protein [Spirochaetota bacterium]
MSSFRNGFFTFFFIILMLSISANEKSLEGKHIKCVISEIDGRFRLYGRHNDKEKWTPLIYEDFPSTSYFRFYKD